MDLVALRMTLRSVLGPHKIVLESLVLTGPFLHSGLIASAYGIADLHSGRRQ